MTIRIHDPIRGAKREFEPKRPGEVGYYVCGMTVQDEPHLGHMFAFLAGDMIRRFLEHEGYKVTYVLNFTDVDDKIIVRAAEEGKEYLEIAERNIRAFYHFCDLLNIRRADVYPRATEHITEILDLVKQLVDKGFAYESKGDVYFEVSRFPKYGWISGRKVEDLRSGARIEPGENKKSPLDFTLWKAARPGEPSWPSPWGPGRPGWHIECSAMSMKYLGKSFDLHGGGQDLIFPHHENESAQSEAAHGRPPVNFWVRNGMVRLGGEKMSKSTGHFLRAAEVSEQVNPRALRLYLLSSHYRSPVEYSAERLREAESALSRIDNFLRNLDLAIAGDPDQGSGGGLGEGDHGFEREVDKARADFLAAMRDDFNSAGALGAVYELVRLTNRFLETGGPFDGGKRALLEKAKGVVLEGLGIIGIEPARTTDDIPQEIWEKVHQREAARGRKDWSEADRLREEITRQGFTIEDREGGTVVRRA